MRVRHFLPALAILGLVPLAAGPAMAAAPGNDEYTGATVLQLGDHITQDTTQATTNSGDEQDNSACGAPATNATVWFQYTPFIDGDVLIDVSKSDYSAGVMVFEGTPSASSLVTCGPGTVGATLAGGTTYYIMAFSDTDTIGGSLDLSLTHAPRPATHVTVAKKGKAFHGGAATLHGTYSCANDFFGSELDAHLLQRAGRLKIQADGFRSVRCDGKKHPYSVRLVSPTGYYAKGAARARISLTACGVSTCAVSTAKGRITLAWASAIRQRQAWMKQPTHLPEVRPHAWASHRPEAGRTLWPR